MGLLEDVIGGVLNPGTRGQAAGGKGGMSPMMMAMMAFLAYRALSGQRGGSGSPRRAPVPSDEAGGGGLGDILGDILGGGRAGAPAPGGPGARVPGGGGLGDILGGILGGGPSSAPSPARGRRGAGLDELSDIIDRFDQNGQGDAARSWVGRGDNQPISPDQMNAVLDEDTISQLQAATGLDQRELLAGLAQTLPGVIDQLTPNGRMPTPDEWERLGR